MWTMMATRRPISKYLFSFFFNDAAALVKHLDPSDIEPAEKVGIRAQLVDWGKELGLRIGVETDTRDGYWSWDTPDDDVSYECVLN